MEDIALSWDGTYIGEFSDEDIIFIKKFDSLDYFFLKPMNAYFILAQLTNLTSCVFDEIKLMFNIQKTGTHWMRINNKIKIIYRANVYEDELICDSILDNEDLEINSLVVRNIMAFRCMFKFKSITYSNLRMRNGIVISFYDDFSIGTYNPSRNLNISACLYNNIFGDKDFCIIIGNILSSKFGISIGEGIIEKIRLDFRGKFQRILKSVNADLIAFENDLYQCLSQTLNLLLL